MDLEAIRASPLGELIPIRGTDGATGRTYQHEAYVPHLMPRSLILSSATWTRVAGAEAALGRLDQAAQQFPNPGLLRRPTLRREAQSTSALEGTFAPLETVLSSETDDRGGMGVELREIMNYIVAAEDGFAWVAERPVTRGALEHLQGILVAGTPGARWDPGRLRTRQVAVGAPGDAIEDSRFVPTPPGDQLVTGVEDWVDWLRDPPAEIAPVARAAIAHYQFETLHPFADGNGRIGRLAIALQLSRDGVLRDPILVVSPWFEARRQQYQDGLLRLSQAGGWDDWIQFFASGVAASADATRSKVERLLTWREDALARVRHAGISGVAERVAEELIEYPIATATSVTRLHGLTRQGARHALERLVPLGLVEREEVAGRVRYVAREVLDLLNT